MHRIGKRIKNLRLSSNMTQEELTHLLDINLASLSSYEIGRRIPSCEIVDAIRKDD